MHQSMLRSAQKGNALKRFVLFIAALMFLGSIEGSTYYTASGTQPSLHSQAHAHAVGRADGLFTENGEECDGEHDVDAYVSAELVHLPQIHFILSSTSDLSIPFDEKSFFSLRNSRAPPAL